MSGSSKDGRFIIVGPDQLDPERVASFWKRQSRKSVVDLIIPDPPSTPTDPSTIPASSSAGILSQLVLESSSQIPSIEFSDGRPLLDERDADKTKPGNIVHLGNFLCVRGSRKPSSPKVLWTPGGPVLDEPDDLKSFAALIGRLIPDIDEQLDFGKVDARCSEVRNRMRMNPEWLEEPVIYNSVHNVFMARGRYPVIRELFEDYCSMAFKAPLVFQLEAAIGFAERHRQLSLGAGVEYFDIARTILGVRKDLTARFQESLQKARRRDASENPMLDALSEIISNGRADLHPAPATRFPRLRRLAAAIRHGHRPR